MLTKEGRVPKLGSSFNINQLNQLRRVLSLKKPSNKSTIPSKLINYFFFPPNQIDDSLAQLKSGTCHQVLLLTPSISSKIM